MKIEGLPVIDVDESEKITVAVRADDLLEGDTGNPDRHPIAIALRRQGDVDDARVTKNETLVRRGKKWFRYDAPNKRLFKQLQKSLTASPD
jgi:tetrahydromethanopterin S-methyltransferase subunit A